MNNYSTYKDEELILLLREQKPACDIAFHEIYQRHNKRLNAYCSFRIKNQKELDDIFQEIWIEFDKAAKEGKPINNIQSYLVGIANNLIKDSNKKSKKEDILFVSIDGIFHGELSNQYDLQSPFEEKELLSIIKAAVSQLEDKYRVPFVLKRYNELSYVEIAKLSFETVDTIRMRYQRAVILLQEILKPYIEEINVKG